MTDPNDKKRLDDLEMGLMLFIAIITGQPEDATPEELEAAQIRFGSIMETMKERQTRR